MSLNRVQIAGRLSKDIELRTTQNGVSVVSFTLAVDGDFKDKQTGKKPVYWIDCVAWRKTAEFMSQYMQKGSMIIVDGKLQTRSWKDKDGNNRKSTEVLAENVYFGESKRESSGYAPDSGYDVNPTQFEFEDLNGSEDELPF